MKASEQQKKDMRLYYIRNKKRLIKKQKIYRLKNIEACKERNREYGRKNRKKVSVLTKIWVQQRIKEIKHQLGDKCKRCGFDDIRALEINHKKVKTKTGRRDYLAKGYDLRKVELLCANCHSIEHYEFYKNNNLKYV